MFVFVIVVVILFFVVFVFILFRFFVLYFVKAVNKKKISAGMNKDAKKK